MNLSDKLQALIDTASLLGIKYMTITIRRGTRRLTRPVLLSKNVKLVGETKGA